MSRLLWVVIGVALMVFGLLSTILLPHEGETISTVAREEPARSIALKDVPPAFARERQCRNATVAIASRLAPESPLCCGPVAGDVDNGLTLAHLMTKFFCTSAQTTRRMRVVQVGANTGDNVNDHLVKFLKTNLADAALLEPVPWIFKKLEQTYAEHRARVRLMNAAMSETDGTVSFQAPDERAKGWDVQRGGINLPASSVRALKRNKALGLFKTITVDSTTFQSLLDKMAWGAEPATAAAVDGGSTCPIDVFVVDAEGYDAVIMTMVLDAVARLFGADARIPILQFEWKHLTKAVRSQLRARLTQLGYCVHQVHYDDVAVLPHISRGAFRCEDSFAI
jgi:FkbM family methyltransferase